MQLINLINYLNMDQTNKRKLSLEFIGNGGELFGILILNVILSSLTARIYNFWGIVKIRQFYCENLVFEGESLIPW